MGKESAEHPLDRNVDAAPQVVFPSFPVTRDLTGDVPDWIPTSGCVGNFGPRRSTHPGPVGQIGGYSDVRWYLKCNRPPSIFPGAPKRWSYVDSREKGHTKRMKGSFVAFGGLRRKF